MRKFLGALLLLTAGAASGEQFGPISVEARRGVAELRGGTMYEFRFVAFNPTAEPHTVRIEVLGAVLGGNTQPRASRTTVIAPRTTAVVSIPQYVLNEYAPREARITVDDGGDQTLALSGYGHSASRGISRQILIGRSVNSVLVTALIPDENIGTAVRPAVPPSSWSANWLHYTPFSGAIFSGRDWNEFSRPVQTALLRWVAAGGTMTFVGPVEGLPALRPARMRSIIAGHHGFGTVMFLPELVDVPKVIPELYASWRPAALDMPHPWMNTEQPTPIPLLDNVALPVKSLFSVLVVFTVVGGPLNLWLLAKKRRRLWIFWTLPAIAFVTAFALIAAVITSEGWVRIQKTISVTLLDERMGEAATLGWTGLFATLPPDGEVRFDSATEVRPMFAVHDAHTDWSDGQRFMSGWVGSRLARGFAVRKVEPRRERIPIRREAGHLVAINGLGTELAELWVADERGVVHSAKNVAAGKEVVLAATSTTVHEGSDPATLFGAPSIWSTYYNRVAGNPLSILRPGMYVAVLERSPFIEAAIARPTTTSANGVVIGLMKGIDDAS